MSALAEQGGTSRQLIYQHFPSLDKLLADTSWHIFTDIMLGAHASIAAHPGSIADAATAADAVTLDLPPGRADLLSQLIAGTASQTNALDQMRPGLSDVITGIWTPLVPPQHGLNEADAT